MFTCVYTRMYVCVYIYIYLYPYISTIKIQKNIITLKLPSCFSLQPIPTPFALGNPSYPSFKQLLKYFWWQIVLPVLEFHTQEFIQYMLFWFLSIIKIIRFHHAFMYTSSTFIFIS